ncbi:methyl-accepting chemotaxis protein [Duganella fentianensis]|uniref:methyl-accepting chemotaxis protein n=1 Tax=Duganella fentianensis TaxID=2692177 RepID=UPI0032B12E1F
MLATFFAPGKRLMRQLRMPTKFSLIVVALLVPLLMLLFLYVSNANQDIDFALKEKTGVRYHRQVNVLMNTSLQHRGQALLKLLDTENPAEMQAAAEQVRAQFASMQKDLEGDDPFQLLPLLKEAEGLWGQALAGTYTETAQITAKYAPLNRALTAMRRRISDGSQLALDPDEDSYYLMLSGTDRMPLITEQLAPLRGLVTYVAAKPDQAQATLVRIAGYLALLRSEIDDVRDELVRAGKANPAALVKVDQAPLAAADAYLKQISDTIVTSVSAVPFKIYGDGTKAINANIQLTNQVLEGLDAALDGRVMRLRMMRNTMLAGVILALSVAAYALVSFYLASLSGLNAITRRVERMGNGDLSDSTAASGKDEVTAAINMVRGSVGKLHQIVAGVRVSAESISLAASEIAAGNNDLAQRGARIAGTVQEASSNMDALDQAVAHNLTNAKMADELALSAFKVASSGEQTVSNAVAMMEKITQSSRKIGEITQVIEGIAFQTNILALNAAVEAARAGEQGRGFAVVASEVRNLAQRSSSAAKEIGDLIRTSIGDVDEGARFVNAAGSTMSDIVQSVQRVNVIMDQITQDSNKQAQQINEMAASVREVDASTQENAAMVEEIAAAVMSLEERATFLSDSVQVFQLGTKVPVHGTAQPRLKLARRSGRALDAAA